MTTLAPNLRFALGGIYAVLLAASAISATAQRFRPALDLTEVKLRIRSWWVMAALFTVALLLHPAVPIVFFALASTLALREFMRMLAPGDRAGRAIGYAAVGAQYALVIAGTLDLIPLVAVATALAVPAARALRGSTEGFAAATGTVLVGIGLTVFGIGHAVYLLALPEAAAAPAGGAGLMVFLVVLTQANDVAQFLTGRTLGKRRIAPAVSPGKTVAGLVGGVSVTTLIAAGISPLLTSFPIPIAAAVGAGLALAGFAGDLTISAAKRDAGVKDAGALLPGHGGVLDRMDSLIFTAPLFFHLVRMWG